MMNRKVILRHSPVAVAAAEGVSTGERNNLLVIEAHAIEYLQYD